MDKIWHRVVIKYLQKQGLAPKDIHADMVATLEDTAIRRHRSKEVQRILRLASRARLRKASLA